jgi:hypothetical protein
LAIDASSYLWSLTSWIVDVTFIVVSLLVVVMVPVV